MKRRGFFAGLFGLAAAPAVAKAIPVAKRPTLRPITDDECRWLREQLELARKRSVLQQIERETRYS